MIHVFRVTELVNHQVADEFGPQEQQAVIDADRPGGRVAILEFSQPKRWPLRQIYQFYFRNILPRIGQWLARNDRAAYEYLPTSVGEFPSGEALADRIRAAGLSDVKYVPMTCGIATLYWGTK